MILILIADRTQKSAVFLYQKLEEWDADRKESGGGSESRKL